MAWPWPPAGLGEPSGFSVLTGPQPDPLELEVARLADSEPAAGSGPPPGPPTTELERLIDERVRLNRELCEIIREEYRTEVAIRTVLRQCTSSDETRAELVRQCFSRARRRLRAELDGG
jgi:hypothetical protein